MKTDPIQDYILRNKHHLRIASAVGEAWTEARQKLVSRFLDRLETWLKKKLRGWEFGPKGEFLEPVTANYYFQRPAWQDLYWIWLVCDDSGKSMYFGVGRDPERLKRRFSQELLNAVTKIHSSAKKERWFEARITMRSPAPDWRKPEVLWRMHKDPKFLAEVAEQLLEVAKISEPIIDRLVRRK
jgi:hypothetical protein